MSLLHCEYCFGISKGNNLTFGNLTEFIKHLKATHFRHNVTAKTGIEIFCLYNEDNKVCDKFNVIEDYEKHVINNHVSQTSNFTKNNGNIFSDKSTPRITIFDTDVNLPAILNNPNNRKVNIFSKQWGESFEKIVISPLGNNYDTDTNLFLQYLSKIGKCKVRNSKRHNKSIVKHEVLSPVKINNILQSLPDLIFSSSFSLRNIDHFHFIFPVFAQHNNIHIPSYTYQHLPENENTNTEIKLSLMKTCEDMHNTLSHHLDVIEVKISQQVTQKSGSFFESIHCNDIIKEGLSDTIGQVKAIRSKINNIELCLGQSRLRVIKNSVKKNNLTLMAVKLKTMMSIHATQSVLQTFLSSSDFCGALDLISSTLDILHCDLVNIKCFKHLAAQLVEMEDFVSKMIFAEFNESIQHLFDLFYQAPAFSAEARECFIIDYDDEAQLLPFILGFVKMKQFVFVDIVRDKVGTAIKDIIKSRVHKAVSRFYLTCNTNISDVNGAADSHSIASNQSSHNSNHNSDSSHLSLAAQMRQLKFSDWLFLFQDLCFILSLFNGKIQQIFSLMKRVLNGNDVIKESETGDKEECLNNDLRGSLVQDIEKAKVDVQMVIQLRLVKVMTLQDKGNEFFVKLKPPQFVELSHSVNSLLTALNESSTESLSTERIQQQPLQKHFLLLINTAINHFHENRKQKLFLIIDNEQWKQTDVPDGIQNLIDERTDSQGCFHLQKSKIVNVSKKSNLHHSSSTSSSLLVVNHERFCVVGTALLLVNIVIEYCEFSADFNDTSSDMLKRLIDLLKIFNSRSCQLILGAGACQMFGLKTISTRSIALTIRSLQLVLLLIENIRDVHAKDQHLVDEITKLYREHILELENRIITVLEGNIEEFTVMWQLKAPIPSLEIQSVCKQFIRVYEAIRDILPDLQLQALFLRIHNIFKLKLQYRLRMLGVKREGTASKNGLLMAEMAFYMDKLHALPGFEMTDDNGFLDVWKQ